MAVLVVARSALLFLLAWEAMALAAYFLVATEDHDAEVRNAAWIYLAASHFATLCLFGVFALMACAGGTWELVPLGSPPAVGVSAVGLAGAPLAQGPLPGASALYPGGPLGSVTPWLATAIFLLSLLGFGTKAGLMPLHVWLPGAHAMAPSHVSAMMS